MHCDLPIKVHLSYFAALFSVIVLLAAFGVMAYMKQPVTTYLYNHFLQFLATSLAFGFLISVAMYIKGRKAPPSERSDLGNTGTVKPLGLAPETEVGAIRRLVLNQSL